MVDKERMRVAVYKINTLPATWYRLHYLKVSEEAYKARLHALNAADAHDFSAKDAQFELITRYFTQPGLDEGFKVVEYD